VKLEDFITYLRSERRYSNYTIVGYRTDITQFYSFLKETFGDIAEDEIKDSMIRSWIVQLSKNNIKPASINRKIASLSTYFHFLLRTKQISKNPILRIHSLKKPKRNPVFIMEKDMRKIIDSLNEDDFFSRQEKLIIELLYATGIRKAEILNIKENDFNFEKQNVRIFGKRRKERLIPLGEDIIELIKRHISEKRKLEIGETKLLVNNKFFPLSIYELDKIVRKFLSMANVEKKSPHVIRHSFATHLLNEGADIMDIKELLGHSSLDATQIYAHNTIERLKSVYKKTHPKGED
jgi:integrase/recombinase XerC